MKIKKLDSIFSFRKIKDAEVVEVWVVSWTSVSYAGYKNHFKSGERKAKAFVNEDDARLFYKSLCDAQNLLQNENDIELKIEKQE